MRVLLRRAILRAIQDSVLSQRTIDIIQIFARDRLMASDDQPKPGESITLDTLQRDILSSANPGLPRRHERSTSPRSLSSTQDCDRVAGNTLRPTTKTRRNRRSSTNQRPNKTPIRPRRRAIAKRSIPENPARPRSSYFTGRTKQSASNIKGPDRRADHLIAKKPRRLLPNPENQQLPTSNPLRAIRRKSRKPGSGPGQVVGSRGLLAPDAKSVRRDSSLQQLPLRMTQGGCLRSD